MSENTDSAAQANGEQTASLSSSTQQTAPNSSVDVDAIVKAMESKMSGMLEPMITSIVEKQWQSGKDKRFAKQEEQGQKLDDFASRLERLEELKADGLSQKQALWQMKMEDSLNNSINAQSSAKEVGDQKTEAVVSDPLIQNVFSSWGIEPTSADYMELLKASSGKEDLLQKGFDLYQRRKQASTLNPDKQMVIPTESGKPSGGDDIDSMTTRLQELQRDPIKNAAAIIELTNKITPLLPTKKK